jgi:multidrug efflux pump subunit AcrA (membrane-fusion protein)
MKKLIVTTNAVITWIGARNKRARILILAVLGIVVVSALIPTITILFFPSEDAGDSARAFGSDSIERGTVAKKAVSDDIEVLGQIVYLEKVNISSKVAGRLEQLYIHEGQTVEKGELIAEIERLPLEINLKEQQAEMEVAARSMDLAKAKYENAIRGLEIKLKTIEKANADLNDKKVSFENMERMLKNKDELFKMGGISESDMESLKAQHTTLYTKYLLAKSDLDIQLVGFRDEDITAEGYELPVSDAKKYELLKVLNTKMERAELEASKSKITQMEKNIESTLMLISETYIRSPLTGYVVAKNMESGEMVKNESVIGIIVNISRVFVSMNINERDIKAIKRNQSVEFTVDALGDEILKGRVDRITPALDPKTRTIEVKAIVNNPENRMLPGMFARAKIIMSEQTEKILIPSAALVKKDEKEAEVYLVSKNIVFKQKVKPGREHGSDIEITEGLSEGDEIIVKGVTMAYPGMKLREIK